MRFGNIVLAYFLMGAILWGGGVIHWNQAGVGSVVIQHADKNATVNASTGQQLQGMKGPIETAVSSVFGGGLLAVIGLLFAFFEYIFWPITTLLGVHAPMVVVVTLGGGLTMAFIVSAISLVRRSA